MAEVANQYSRENLKRKRKHSRNPHSKDWNKKKKIEPGKGNREVKRTQIIRPQLPKTATEISSNWKALQAVSIERDFLILWLSISKRWLTLNTVKLFLLCYLWYPSPMPRVYEFLLLPLWMIDCQARGELSLHSTAIVKLHFVLVAIRILLDNGAYSQVFLKFLLKKHSFFVAAASYWRQSDLCRWDEWVRVTKAFRSWPNFDFVFPGARNCFFQRIWVDRHLHLMHIWVLFSCEFWCIATTAENGRW